ncbi:MAG: SpoIID/LytB domain-containing protein [bacterium]|nr:SpoIID/LytB domain-containing protein [bacterium]
MKKYIIILLFICYFIITISAANSTKLLKTDFENLRILIDSIDSERTNLVVKGNNISLRYSTQQFPSIYQGGFYLANQITILNLNPALKFFYDHNYDKTDEIPEYKDIMILSSNYLEYKNRKYRGKFFIVNKDKKYYLVNLVEINEYLKSVVPSEMPSSWDIEALKAQAIAARTYAIKVTIERRKKGEVFDLYSTVLDQAYYGIDKENPRTDEAVERTKDLIIVYDNQPIWALYHSNCGGQTIDGRMVFPKRLDPTHQYLSSVKCQYSGKKWENKVELYTIKKNLEKSMKVSIYSIENIYTNNFRTYIVYNKNSIYSLYNWEIRKLIGYNVIRSPYINKLSIEGEHVVFEGTGFGHGVGLCQFGANTLAKNGFNYQDIIKYYYKNVEIIDLGRWLENANI